ncbi:hypothetical protein FI667_g3560, partial [Globisporangium splendens]
MQQLLQSTIMATSASPSVGSTQSRDVDTRSNSSGGGSKAGGAITYGKSWADDIQKYHAAKATLPWKPEQQTPVKYVTRFEKSREEREYDLVLGKFRDTEREAQLTHHEQSKLQTNLENARVKQLRNVQRFNVVNHAPMYQGARDPKDTPPQPHPSHKQIVPQFDIISNVSYSTSSSSNNNNSPETSSTPSRRTTREFNILTNKYHENHEARSQLGLAKKKEIAAIKYNKTHDYDPVRITYVDPDKEQQFIKTRAHEQAIHGKDRVKMLPPRTQFSEGRLYNILNQQVLNEEILAEMVEHGQCVLHKMQKTAFEAKMRVVGDEMRTKETELCLNRYAHERNSQSYVHRYDPISNQSFDGRHAKPKLPTRTHAALSAWQVLESGVAANTKISPQKEVGSNSGTMRTTASSETSRGARCMTPTSATLSKRSAEPLPLRPNVLVVDQSLTPLQVCNDHSLSYALGLEAAGVV